MGTVNIKYSPDLDIASFGAMLTEAIPSTFEIELDPERNSLRIQGEDNVGGRIIVDHNETARRTQIHWSARWTFRSVEDSSDSLWLLVPLWVMLHFLMASMFGVLYLVTVRPKIRDLDSVLENYVMTRIRDMGLTLTGRY